MHLTQDSEQPTMAYQISFLRWADNEVKQMQKTLVTTIRKNITKLARGIDFTDHRRFMDRLLKNNYAHFNVLYSVYNPKSHQQSGVALLEILFEQIDVSLFFAKVDAFCQALRDSGQLSTLNMFLDTWHKDDPNCEAVADILQARRSQHLYLCVHVLWMSFDKLVQEIRLSEMMLDLLVEKSYLTKENSAILKKSLPHKATTDLLSVLFGEQDIQTFCNKWTSLVESLHLTGQCDIVKKFCLAV